MRHIALTLLACTLFASSAHAQSQAVDPRQDLIVIETARQWETGEACKRQLNENDLRLVAVVYELNKRSIPHRLARALELMNPQDRTAWYYAQLLVMRVEVCVMHLGTPFHTN